MTEPADGPPATGVVVGVDGSDESRRALEWAVGESLGSSRPLRIVHAVPFEQAPRHGGPDLHLQEAEQRLRDTTDHARVIGGPSLTVTGEVLDGLPIKVLLEESRRSSVVVIGSRGLGRFARVLLGSTALDVATRASCPVVVIPSSADLARRRSGIVVGVDAANPSEEALRFAFARAERLDSRLIALHVTDSTLSDAQADASLASVLVPWQLRYQRVPVEARAVPGDPIAELAEASKDAEVVVVGAGRRSAWAGAALGSVSHGLLHGADCPVVVPH